MDVSFRFFFAAPLAVILLLAAPPVFAGSPFSSSRTPAEGNKSDHLEATMGFVAGERSYGATTFDFSGGSAAGLGGGALVKPFERPPFTRVTALGLRYDLRLVVSHVRMTVGFDKPFTTYRAADATGTYTVGGKPRTITVQSLSPDELRFGLGGELPIGPVSPFVDVIGGVHWVTTNLVVDGEKATFRASGFAFSARGGLRLHVRSWFFAQAAGEVGIVGDLRWNAELSVGFALP
jgi:hypothetical protein